MTFTFINENTVFWFNVIILGSGFIVGVLGYYIFEMAVLSQHGTKYIDNEVAYNKYFKEKMNIARPMMLYGLSVLGFFVLEMIVLFIRDYRNSK